MFGNLSSTITSVFGSDLDLASIMSKFGELTGKQGSFVQALMDTLHKVDFPELKDAILNGNFNEVVSIVQHSKETNPEFHKQFTENHAQQMHNLINQELNTDTQDQNNISQPITTHHAELNIDLKQAEDPNDGSVFAEMKNLGNLEDEATYNENKS